MGISRYELSDVQWEKIHGFLPGRAEHVGRTASDNRLFVNGVLWVLRSGARWYDLSERYGMASTRASISGSAGGLRKGCGRRSSTRWCATGRTSI